MLENFLPLTRLGLVLFPNVQVKGDGTNSWEYGLVKINHSSESSSITWTRAPWALLFQAQRFHYERHRYPLLLQVATEAVLKTVTRVNIERNSVHLRDFIKGKGKKNKK